VPKAWNLVSLNPAKAAGFKRTEVKLLVRPKKLTLIGVLERGYMVPHASQVWKNGQRRLLIID